MHFSSQAFSLLPSLTICDRFNAPTDFLLFQENLIFQNFGNYLQRNVRAEVFTPGLYRFAWFAEF
jgi:hypothetical protein